LSAKGALRPRLQLVLAAALFSTAGAALKAIHFDTWQVASFRAALAMVAVLVLVPSARRGLRSAFAGRRAALPMAGAAAVYALTAFLFVAANKATTAASTIFLQSTSPLYIAVLGHWLLHERVRRVDFVFMLVLAGGLGLLLAGTPPPARTAPHPLLGNVLAAVCGLTVGIMVVLLRGLGRGGDGGRASAAVVLGNLLVCVIALPLVFPLPVVRAADVGLLLWLGLVQIGAAYALMLAGLRHVPALEASLLMLIEPVLSPVWAWLVHGEAPGPWVIAGGMVILAASVAQVWSGQRSGAVAPAAPVEAPPAPS
jgi:drug/metabolite transporter, DME family